MERVSDWDEKSLSFPKGCMVEPFVNEEGLLDIRISDGVMHNARREEDLTDSIGWVAVHKVHKSNKTYSRKHKHKDTISS